MRQISYRFRQGISALRRKQAFAELPERFFDPRVWELFEALALRDRAHLLAAYHVSLESTDDQDVQLATLLHDIGKATLSGKRISLVARVCAVVLPALPGDLRARFRQDREGAWLTGWWLAEHHAPLGGERLRALGMSEDVCRLVELHDTTEVADEHLQLLHEIDSATL